MFSSLRFFHQEVRILLRLIVAASLITLLPDRARAEVSTPFSNFQATPANEFFVGREFGKPLVTINLVNGVSRPGVYHVPTGTDLAELLAYAGGATDKADLNSISIRRTLGKEQSTNEITFEKLIASRDSMPQVVDRDVVYIAPKTNLDTTVAWIGLISGIASIALSITLIRDINRRE